MKKSLFVEITVIRILVVLLQLIFLKIYSNYTSLYELGISYFLITISYSLNAFVLVPLDYFQQSKLYNLKANKYSLRSYYGISAWVVRIMVIFLLIALSVCYFINKSYCYIVPLVLLLATSLYFVTFIRGIINNLERRRIAIYCVLIENVSKVLFYFLFIKFFKPTAVVILSSTVSASLLILVVLIFVVKRLPEFKLPTIISFQSKEIFHFAYPISISSVINWIQIQGYRMILVPLGLVEVVGIYGTVAGVGINGMGAYSTVFSQIFVPNLYKTDGAYIKKYCRNGFLSILFVLVCGYFLSGFLIAISTKHEFVKYASVIVYGILSEGGNLLIGALTIYLTIQNRTKISIKSSIAGLISFFVAFFLLYLFKIVNVFTVGIPIVFTQIIVTAYLYVIVNKIIKEKNGSKKS